MEIFYRAGFLVLSLTLPGGALAAESCPAAGSVQAVDLSHPVTQPFLDKMRQIGVKTIIRYYDNAQETIKGKTLQPAERALIARSGFDVLVVFQHNNDKISSFTPQRGRADAERSLALAGVNSQPRGSAIYFGVDGDWRSASEQEKIKTYFRVASPLVRKEGYKMGAYGSGLTCTQLLREGLIDHCWLANAGSWPGRSAFLASGQWSLVQSLPKSCGGRSADFNVQNPSMADVGQFRP